MLVINQPKLGITNVQVSFGPQALPDPTSPAKLVLREPREVPYPVPFGKCLFMDTTFLPGTVTFQLFGHEVELMPRVLIIDGKENPWRPGAMVVVPSVGVEAETGKLKTGK